MKILTRSEEFLLLSIWRLQNNAYGVTIREQLKKATGKTWAFGALFVSLDRLVQKGHLTSFLSDPTPERGGRSKRIYKVTEDGLQALVKIKQIERSMWDDLPDVSLGTIPA